MLFIFQFICFVIACLLGLAACMSFIFSLHLFGESVIRTGITQTLNDAFDEFDNYVTKHPIQGMIILFVSGVIFCYGSVFLLTFPVGK